MSILSNLFGGHSSNPEKAANKYLDQIPGVGHQGYDPWVQPGLDSAGKSKELYDRLMSDPTGFINEIMGKYEPSEAYQFNKGLLTKELGNTAAAGGVAGTPLDQLNQGQAVQGLLSNDQQQFLTNIMNALGIGVQGEEKSAERGYDATKNLTDLLGGTLNTKAGLAFQNSQQKNQNKNDIFKLLAKALGTGAGYAVGGPAGGAIGGGLTSSMYGGG